jgi:hypothetical protein
VFDTRWTSVFPLSFRANLSAIVLANVAELAGIGQGPVGRLLILSYVVSPSIAFTVAVALRMISSLA